MISYHNALIRLSAIRASDCRWWGNRWSAGQAGVTEARSTPLLPSDAICTRPGKTLASFPRGAYTRMQYTEASLALQREKGTPVNVLRWRAAWLRLGPRECLWQVTRVTTDWHRESLVLVLRNVTAHLEGLKKSAIFVSMGWSSFIMSH